MLKRNSNVRWLKQKRSKKKFVKLWQYLTGRNKLVNSNVSKRMN